MRDGLRLTGLEKLHQLEGYRFDDLPPALANALLVRPYLRVVTLLRQSDPDLKYEVFTRLNTGGEPLNAQEVRNVVFRGPLNDLVYTLSQHGFLHRQLKIANERSPAFRNMVDAEYVLRFLTLLDNWQSFSGELGRSMDDFMLNNQHPDPDQLTEFHEEFDVAIAACEEIWGDHAFQRPVGNGWRDQALAGVYDAQMVSLAQFMDDEIDALVARKTDVISATRRLFRDERFDVAARVGTNTPGRVRYRIEQMTDTLRTLTHG